MIWMSKEWLIKIMTTKNDIDFNNFRKYELVQILNKLRLMLDERKFKNEEDF